MTEDIFSNCTEHYQVERYFRNCTNTTRQCELIHDLALVAELILIFEYYISTVLFCTALVVNVYYFSIVFPMFLKLDIDTQKRYVFGISRCVSSIFAAATLLLIRCILYVYFPPGTSSYSLYVIVFLINNISFFSLQGAYIGMGSLLYIGVIHPLFYSTRLSLRKIYFLNGFNWGISFLISLPFALFEAATFTPGPISCDSQVCSPIMTLIDFIIISLYFLLTICIISFVLICLSWHIYKERKSGSYTSSQTIRDARIRLAWTLFAIVFISLAEGIPSSFQLGLKADNTLDSCNNFYQADKLVTITLYTSFDSVVWAVVLLIDPIANIIFDKKVSSEVMRQVDKSKVLYAKFLNLLKQSFI